MLACVDLCDYDQITYSFYHIGSDRRLTGCPPVCTPLHRRPNLCLLSIVLPLLLILLLLLRPDIIALVDWALNTKLLLLLVRRNGQ